METLNLKLPCLIASAKVQNAVGAFHLPILVGKFPTLYTNRLCEKCPNTEIFLIRILLYLDWIRIFNSKYRKIWTSKNSVFGHISGSDIFGLSILWMVMVYIMCGSWIFLLWLRYIVVFEWSRHNMVGRFAIRHL